MTDLYLLGLEAAAGKDPWYDQIAMPQGRSLLREPVVQASAPWTWPKVKSRHTRMEEKFLYSNTQGLVERRRWLSKFEDLRGE